MAERFPVEVAPSHARGKKKSLSGNFARLGRVLQLVFHRTNIIHALRLAKQTDFVQ